jgi:hypothetical protein
MTTQKDYKRILEKAKRPVFSNISKSVLVKAICQLEKNEQGSLLDKINDIAFDKFMAVPCPKGGQHDMYIQQLGNPEDGNRLCNDPLYSICRKCDATYWPLYIN